MHGFGALVAVIPVANIIIVPKNGVLSYGVAEKLGNGASARKKVIGEEKKGRKKTSARQKQ